MEKTSLNTTILLRLLGCIVLAFSLFGFLATASAQENDAFPKPDTYKTEGIPTIKNSDVTDLVYDPAAIRSNLIWDADRKNRRLLVTDEKNNIYLLDQPLSVPINLLDKIIPKSVKVRPDGGSFAYTADHEDEDNYQLYLYDFKDKSSKKLITLTGKDESVDSFIWTKNGDSLVYLRNDYILKTGKLCQFNFLAERCYSIELKGLWDVIDASGTTVLLKYWKSSTSQYLYAYNIKTNKLTPIDEEGNSRKGFIVGQRVFWTSEGSDLCQKKACILSLDLKSWQRKKLNLPENLLNVDEVKFSPDGGHLLIQESKDSVDNIRIFRIQKDKIVKELSPFVTGPFVIWNTRWLSNDEVAYTLENIGKPASIQSFNLDSKTITKWTIERLPEQLTNKIQSPQVIKWKSFDQMEITGYVVRPTTTVKRSPVLIYVHGGPQILDKPVFNSQDIRFASTLGLTIIHTNIRGSSGFGREFMDADNKEKRGDPVKDIQALLDWIKTQPDLDSSQIFLRGVSYGGFVVLSAALQEPLRIKGVIAESPLISIRGFLSQSWIDEFAKSEYGDPKDESAMSKLDMLSPLGNTTKWGSIPVFLTRGKLDSRIPEKDVMDLKTQLQMKESEVWFIYSNNSGHGFGGKYVTAAMYMFLKKQIKKEK